MKSASSLLTHMSRQLTILLSSVTGLLLAGVGHVTDPPDSQRNFLVCDNKTEKQEIEEAFNNYTKKRKDIGIVLINQHVSRRCPNRRRLRC